MGNFIVDYQKVYSLDEAKAMTIYREAMTFEWKNFEAAIVTYSGPGEEYIQLAT